MTKHGHGSMTFKFGYGPFKTPITVHAGPITMAPSDMLAVNLRAEAPEHGNYFFPIKDFSIPLVPQTMDLMENLLSAGINRGELYVGCAGGTGRTGLILAMFARVASDDPPVSAVRAAYKKHAVETSEQMEFVHSFPPNWIASLKSDANRAGAKRFFTRFF